MLQFQALDAAAVAGYRMLAHATLDESARKRFPSINGVALGKMGPVVLLVSDAVDEIADLRASTDIAFDIRVVGDIALAAQGGDSLAASGGHKTPGTLGCLVQDAFGTVFALTSDHVVGTLGGQSPGMRVHSPSGSSTSIGGFGRGTSVILSSVASNQVDAALVDLSSPSVHVSAVHGIGKPVAAATPVSLGDSVRKYGHSSKHTTGTVMYFASFLVPYHGGQARFIEQIGIENLTSPFALQGDSGSVVMRNLEAVGLILAVALGGHLVFANDMDNVLTHLGVSIV